MSGLDITMVQWDDYTQANGRALAWVNTLGSWCAGDLSDATINFTVLDQNQNVVLTAAGVVVTATGSQQVIVELASSATGLLTLLGKQYCYLLVLSAPDNRETEVRGAVTVLAGIEP